MCCGSPLVESTGRYGAESILGTASADERATRLQRGVMAVAPHCLDRVVEREIGEVPLGFDHREHDLEHTHLQETCHMTQSVVIKDAVQAGEV